MHTLLVGLSGKHKSHSPLSFGVISSLLWIKKDAHSCQEETATYS